MHLIAPGSFKQGHQLSNTRHITALQHHGRQPQPCIGWLQQPILGLHRTIRCLAQLIGWRINHLDAIHHLLHLWGLPLGYQRNGPVWGNTDPLKGRQRDRPKVTQHRPSRFGHKLARWRDLQRGCAHKGFTTIGAQHGNPAAAIHGHVEITTCWRHGSWRKVNGWRFRHGLNSGRQNITKHRHGPLLEPVRQKPLGIHVGKIIVMAFLRQE